MRLSSGSRSAGKNKPFFIIFIIIFLFVAGAIIFGITQQRRTTANIEEGRSKIELVKDETGRTVLTDDLLRSDYGVYVKNANTNLNIMLIVMGALAFGLLAWFVTMLIGFIRSLKRGDTINFLQVIPLVMALIFLIVGGSLFIKSSGSMMNKRQEDPETATISLEYAQVVRKDSREVRSGRGKHKTRHTEHYIYLSDGRELSVTKYVYDEVEGAGYYYIGKNAEGSIFGMYPENSYCMEEF